MTPDWDRAAVRQEGAVSLSAHVRELERLQLSVDAQRSKRDVLMRSLNRSGTFTHAELAELTGLSCAGVRAAISRAATASV